MTEDLDAEAAAFYEDPRNREPEGSGHRRAPSGRRLSEHVPIRFDRATVDRVRQIAQKDGQTVSSWIRTVVEREVERRLPSTDTGLSKGAQDLLAGLLFTVEREPAAPSVEDTEIFRSATG